MTSKLKAVGGCSSHNLHFVAAAIQAAQLVKYLKKTARSNFSCDFCVSIHTTHALRRL